MSHRKKRLATTFGAVLTAAALIGTLAACSGDASASTGDSAAGTVTVGAHANGAGTETTITVGQVDEIRNTLPKSVLDSGELTIGVGALPAGFPPLAFTGDDQETLTGSEPDLGRLVAAVFGLKPVVDNSTWDNLFVGIDTAKTDVGFSNITDTEQRKEKYDFASYRQDNLAFTTLATSDWTFTGKADDLAGKTVSVSAGTNQEKLILEWQSQLQAEGKNFDIKYFPDTNSVYLALNSKQIDTYFGPNPGIAYQNSQTASAANPTRTAGVYSGAGSTLQGLIAATTKKDSGLAEPLAAAINYLIENGQYAQWLAAYNLTNEAVTTSEVNPAGLPITNQ
ncbi:ABC transporter substrate-binding protein [Subtercola boreus]|uniref:ABC transporter substrate-binding protein n=1 Tax=Subtercola boreus TaxID=120213 RepID=A0A3E0VGZ6_9MICO|nr:transporter substrate-binding domain-containing protein [Subtercola boreus]RFA09226.1 ABC transporter substrate-binding protein [Subtercola boreus]TQL53750.1 amino acid ABC transporter substrate-binding protein (PAAT family) [Subtercola boreus]